MALNLDKNLKRYYSIREVADMFGLNESTLRYWEQEFPYLKPKTSGPAKIRQYQEKDIEQIRVIHNLVKVRGFKLAAAKKILSQNRKGADKKTAHLLFIIISFLFHHFTDGGLQLWVSSVDIVLRTVVYLDVRPQFLILHILSLHVLLAHLGNTEDQCRVH